MKLELGEKDKTIFDLEGRVINYLEVCEKLENENN